MKKLTGLTLVLAALLSFVPRFAFADANARYFDKFTAPAQSYYWPSGSDTAIGTTPWRAGFESVAGHSTTPILGPVLVLSSNTQRIGWWIQNISTFIWANPLGDIEIYIGTSPHTTGWDSTLANQTQQDMAFSSNSRPVPLTTSWVIGRNSTNVAVDVTPSRAGAFGTEFTLTLFSSNTIPNPHYGSFQNTPYVRGNLAFQLPSNLITYVGDIYAVAVGTFTAGATSAGARIPGRVRAVTIVP